MKYIGLVILVFLITDCLCQDDEYPIIQNFDHKDYQASNSNFGLTQDSFGVIYAANIDGILYFNGENWNSLAQGYEPFFSIFYSKTHNLIFYGKKNDFGFLSADEIGILQTHSLLPKDDKELNQFIPWQINETLNGEILFLTTQGLYGWNKDKVGSIKGSFYNQFFVIKDNLLVPDRVNGISIIKDFTHVPLKGAQELNKENLRMIYGEIDSLKIITEKKETFILKNGKLLKSTTQNKLLDDKIQIGITLTNGSAALGYQKNGLVLINKSALNQIEKSAGIKGEFVKFIFEDTENNIWLALQQGISKVQISNPNVIPSAFSKIEGTPWSILCLKSEVLVGTTEGLYTLRKGKINEVQNHVWSISKFGNKAVVGLRNGLFLENSDSKIFEPFQNFNGVSLVKEINDSILLVATLNSLNLLSLNKNVISLFDSISISANTFNSAIQDVQGDIWISAKSSGIYKWERSTDALMLFDNIYGFQNTNYFELFLIENRVYVFCSDGLYKLDSSKTRFTKVFDYHKTIEHAFQLSSTKYIVSAKDKFGDLSLDLIEIKNDSYKVISRKYNGFDYSEITDIEKDHNGDIWFATPEGLFKYDSDNTFNYQTPFNTLVNEVASRDSLIFGGHYSDSVNSMPRMVIDQPDSYKPNLEYSNNALKFEFGAPFFTQNEKIQFAYYLEGNEETWSPWNKERVKEYNNLAPGTYTFHVKSKNVFDVIGRTADYTFTILPPWYMTTWAYVLFTAAAVFMVWLISLSYSYRVRLQRKKLKLIVADRTFEVLSQKKEIEKQNLKLKEQYEEISEKRDAIREKNQELEMSQKEILIINEQLQILNTSLEKKVDERTSKLKVTVKKLQKTISELDTFIYRASHDLKGPISRINGLTSLAKLESSDFQELKYFDLIDLVAKDMNKLLAKLTQVHEVINRDLEMQLVDLPVVITEVRESISFVDSDNNTHYSFELNNLLQIKSDRFLISIIFSNLIENALIFKKHRQTDHELKIRATEDHDNYYITFEDNGIGIQKEHIGKIFNMFYRGSDQSKGNGLGLYLSRMATDKLGGKIRVESQYNKYTRFHITLPK